MIWVTIAVLASGLVSLNAAARDVDPGDGGRVVLVRSTGNLIKDGPVFLQAMTASGVDGHPVCLLVGEVLSAAQEDLLARLPGAEIVAVGELPAAIAERAARTVSSPSELFAPSTGAVVCSKHIADIMEAAPEAYRRGVPLLFGGVELAGELQRLGIEEVWIVSPRIPVGLPASLKATDLSDPEARWKAVCADNPSPYLAATNGNIIRAYRTGAPLGGALLAANHRGMLVHATEQQVQFHYALLENSQRPDGLEDSRIERWLVGEFEIDGTPRRVAVPIVGLGIGITGFVPRYGDPVVDGNDDGFFDAETETVIIGETCMLGEERFSISLRAIGAIGQTKFRDGMYVNRAVAVSPPAEAIAARLKEVYGDSPLPRSLLVVGDHREIPFDYVKDPVYAASIMHEQELASDNLYADPDGDGYLDIDVGRFVSSDAVQATTLASRLATYPDWKRAATVEACLIYPAWKEDEALLGSPTIFANFEAFLQGVQLDFDHVGIANHMQLRERGALELVLPLLARSTVIVFAHHSGPEGWMFRIEKKGEGYVIDALATPTAASGTALPFLDAAPFIVGAGCDSAGLDFEVPFEDSIVHAFFEQGAIAYAGNTRAGFPDTEEFLLRQMLQGVVGLLPSGEEPQTLGAAFRSGKNYLDLLIRERGPFAGVAPFGDYSLPMRREWWSLVLYGDPALRLHLPARAPVERRARPVEVRCWGEGDARIHLRFLSELEEFSVLITKEVGVGPHAEVSALTAAGLSYGSVPWATYADVVKPGPVGPGVFLELVLPDSLGAISEVTVVEGPAWALGGWRVVEGARGVRRLLVSVDLVRYAMAEPEKREVVEELVLAVE